jgi:uncharacterized protein YecE (DUF72 family)
MATYWIGTSGYSYKAWKGPFYPESLPDGEMLRYYGERFTGVEINYTFYRFATVRQLQSWAKEVPEHFTFTLKAPRRITHEMRLRDAADVAADFCDTARALKNRLGALLFQLPPFLKRDTPRLEDFLHQLPEGFASPSSSATRPGSRTRCTKRCAASTWRCASSRRRNARSRSR